MREIDALPGHAVLFQSAPAIAGGRCQRADAFERADDGFNPRPPLLAGDARARPPGRGAARRFNPRPPLLAGDAAGRCPGGRRTCRFNPRPPLLAGDARGSCCQSPCHPRFNPRPPLLAGDAHVVDAGLVVFVVSIRARHCWRAMPPLPPSPPLPAMFQSAPAIAGGRCTAVPSAMVATICFNPRPPLLAGDAAARWLTSRSLGVSIRARHCWRAMLGDRGEARTMRAFQSAPAIAGGRCRHHVPARPGSMVSIRARHCWRAMLPLPGSPTISRKFQSAPAIAGGRCGRVPRHS